MSTELIQVDFFLGSEQVRKTITVIIIVILTGTGCNPAGSSMPDVFLIIIDTLRADHLSCYGYARATSPVLDSLAASGTLFTQCQAQAPWTLPAHASIWTGLSVASHMAGIRDMITYGLSTDFENIATILKNEGYVTLGFVNVILLSNSFGFANGFDYYSWIAHGHGRAAETVDEVLEWFIDNRANPNPKLVVIHLFDVHAPYDPPAPFDTRFSFKGTEGITDWEVSDNAELLNPEARDHLINMYDGEIAWVDSQLGRLFGQLRELGIAQNALIIVTSDHGEEFLEHGLWGHGHSLYQELLHVPLIISGPGIPSGAVNATPAAQYDILPIIAGYTGISAPDHVEGMDLFSPSHELRIIPSSGAIVGHCCSGNPANFESLCSVLDRYRKGIYNFYTGDEQMFDLMLDPGEHHPQPLDSMLLNSLEYYRATPPMVVPPVTRGRNIDETLRDLGYI